MDGTGSESRGPERSALTEGLSARLPWLLLAVSLALFAWEMRSVPPQADDAFISYRYARNLVEGQGLVYNPGERVEGYTNLLWTLSLAGGLKLGLRAEVAAHLLSLLSGWAALLFALVYARAGLPRSRAWLAGFAPLLLLCSPSFAVWSSSGMETPLFAAALTAALAADARRRPGWLTSALALATLTRPEGALAAAVLYAFHLHRGRGDLRRALGPLLIYACLLLAITFFRLLYYDAWLPNTFHAKAGGLPLRSGALYLAGSLLSGPIILLAAALPAAARRAGEIRPAAALLLAFSLYIVCIGGDAFNQWRFFLPLLPALIGLAAWGCAAALDEHRGLGLLFCFCFPATALLYLLGSDAALALVVLALASFLYLGIRRSRLRPLQLTAATMLAAVIALCPLACRAFDELNRKRGVAAVALAPSRSAALSETRRFYLFGDRLARLQARMIADVCGADCPVAALSIGMFGYYSRLPIVDLLGIVDPVVAHSRVRLDQPGAVYFPGHQKTHADHVLERRPAYILVGARTGYTLPALLQLYAHPRFRRDYVYDRELYGYARREGGKRVR
jgi:arabinofuranosyltransferase